MQRILNFEKNGINYHVYKFNGSASGAHETLKDVGALEAILYAVDQGANVIVNITSGNYGEALKHAASEYNKGKPLDERVRVVHILFPGDQRMVKGLAEHFPDHGAKYSIPFECEEMKTKWLTEQDRLSIARKVVEEESDSQFEVKGIVDVTHHIPDEYIKQAEDILLQKPNGKYLDYLAIPVGTGKGFISFYRALENLRKRGIDINTRLMGIVPKGENPIYHNFVGLEYVIKGFDPNSKADKLSCPGTDLLPELEKAMSEGHLFVEVDNKHVTKANLAFIQIKWQR